MCENNKIKTIGVLTSGGDSPGMNAAIRSVVRTAIFNKKEVIGIRRGYEGLVNRLFIPMQSYSVGKIISLGGTMLKTARCPEFKEKKYRKQAYNNLRNSGIDALVIIGGDGSFRGAKCFSEEYDIPVIGIPGTIDNDIYGTDMTIGFDTALNTAVEAIDKLRDTADSHNRIFFVEVMGRDAGHIALNTAVASGAEAVLIPEINTSLDSLYEYLMIERRKNKTSGIVIVAEGEKQGNTFEIAAKMKERLPQYETRVAILGHIQRGGSPSCYDRVLASNLGYYAVKGLLEGQSKVMVGKVNSKYIYTPFEEALSKHPSFHEEYIKLTKILSI
ncbi:MAG: 6-phosphofructokinase [Bacteroidales bacterium]